MTTVVELEPVEVIDLADYVEPPPLTIVQEEPLVQVTLQDVQFLEDHVKVTLTGGIEKVISLDDFRSILNSSLGSIEDTKLDGFSLPSNVFYFAKSNSQIQISCYYQARVSTIKYHSYTKKIVMPNLIISHTLNKTGDQTWHVSRSRYFCTDLTVGRLPRSFIGAVDTSKHVFLMPMSNTYGEGHMCYGGNSMPATFKENNLRGLDWYYQYMFESPFNDDLGIAAVSGIGVADWYKLLENAATKGEEFPYKKLRGFVAA